MRIRGRNCEEKEGGTVGKRSGDEDKGKEL